ncbi:hypothetical protein LAZ67_23001726 [Cordylochernes scorpioides]|uniref:Uncharacterized protein n=1 Tax=Cordylochernes scorpioides TaxID=51811 RepID=A0ABY6LQX7_9ARAC|nr:hypothetical protein LAZ67_23001726 [Cordylochernes scorpioides]
MSSGHIILRAYVKPKKMEYFTQGPYDITEVLAYHPPTNKVYYISTREGRPGERHLYYLYDQRVFRVPVCVTCGVTGPGCLSARATFSPTADFYVLECLGPRVPTVELWSTANDTLLMRLDTNQELEERMRTKAKPKVRTFAVPITGGYSKRSLTDYPYDGGVLSSMESGGAIVPLVSHISEFPVHGYRSGSGLTTPYFAIQGSPLLNIPMMMVSCPSMEWKGVISPLVSHISEFPVHGYRSGSGLTTPYFALQGSPLLNIPMMMVSCPSMEWKGVISPLVSHISEFPIHGYRSGSGLTTPYFALQGMIDRLLVAQAMIIMVGRRRRLLLLPGGPGEQLVDERWGLHWGAHLASQMGYVFAQTDGRGSGGQGDKLRHEVYRRLGTVEVADQIEVAKYLKSNLPFIGPAHVAIWGWGYGGFVTLSALAAQSEQVFRCGAAVAPVSSWAHYSSAYAERYMGSPNENFLGYEASSLLKKAELLRGQRLLVAHGTADERVPFQHSSMLMKALAEAGVVFKSQRMPGHRKRRQFKQTDAFTRGMVIGLKRAGWSIRQIAADTHLGASTVHRLWRRWLEQGNVAIYRNVGATRVTSARVDRRILRQAVAAPQATCTAILQHVQDTLDHSISTRTISRRLVANGLHSCRPLRRLPLTPPNRRQRLEWCRARSTWMTEWHRVVFSDESRFCLSSDSRRVRVWRRRGERSNPVAIVERPTVRQRGIMVWGAIAYDSRSPLLRIQGTMTAQRYVDDVLRPVTLPYLQGVPNALYQQDNARPHTARISQQALQDVQMLPWPPYSPDLSPIEHVWDIIGRRLHALPQPRSEDELWQMVEREWRAIPQDAIRTLIDSLPRRVAACIAIVHAVNVQVYPDSRHDLSDVLPHLYRTLEDFLGACFHTTESDDDVVRTKPADFSR